MLPAGVPAHRHRQSRCSTNRSPVGANRHCGQLEPVIIVAKSPVEPDPSSDGGVPATIIVPVVIVVIGACALGSAWLARIMVRRRKQQPLGTATRMKTPNAEADFEMHMTDKGDFNLGSGRPAEDQYGSYRPPSEPLEMPSSSLALALVR